MNLPAAPWLRLPARIPFPLLALAVCLLFAAPGLAALDDYGITRDEPAQRRLAARNAAYIAGDRDARPGAGQDNIFDNYYGVVFELPLLLAERLLGLRDSRDIYLFRHLLIHLVFIAGGFFCGLLAWRMFNNRWLALLAMLLFLLHPRLYAHSFFNGKDIPFAALFVVALYLTHRAFRRDTLGAFVLLGIVVGLAVNMRPFALLLPPAVLALRGLDFGPAPGGAARKRILLTAGSFAAATLLAIYASHPNYWENPLLFIEGLQRQSQHPVLVNNLFRGEIVPADAAPAGYIPVWFGITAPPGALLLGAAGMAAALWRGCRSPGLVWRKGELRFLLLLLGCLALPVAVVIVLQSHIYNGWRQMYFLWGPFCLLAAAGVGYAVSRPELGLKPMLRMAVWGLAAAGLGGAAYAIVSLHPHQQVYFNLLVNRAAPDELGQQYDMDYWKASYLQGLEYLLESHPDTTLYVAADISVRISRDLLPAAERERIALQPGRAEFIFHHYMDPPGRARTLARGLVVYERRAYGSAYLTVTAPRLVWGGGAIPGAAVYRAAYRRVTAASAPAARSDFDVYLHDGALYYVKENCRPEDAAPPFFLRLYPVSDDDLPDARREYGYELQKFEFSTLGGFFDGRCITQQSLPGYELTRISTGQQASGGETRWQAEIPLALMERVREIEAGLAGGPPVAAGGGYELYLDRGMLVYRRENCAAADVGARFYLHLFPADAADLPVERREHGFVNRGFDFPEYGAMRGGQCLAAAPLPDYPIARIRTGQWRPAVGQLWRADFPVRPPARPVDAGQ